MRPLVLLIEPEPMLRLTMTKFLQSSGYGVTACPEVDAAVRVFRSTTPQLIVLALRILDGQALAETRRLREATAGVPILGVADIAELPAGAALPDQVRFLAPPFDMPDLLRAVRSSLRQSQASPSLELEA
jgi:two-component system OmpR family response regulator